MKDAYCPKCKQQLIHNTDSLLFGENFYCKECDKIFVLGLKELSKDWFKRNFNNDRFYEIAELSFVKEARKKVTKKQLEELGLLN